MTTHSATHGAPKQLHFQRQCHLDVVAVEVVPAPTFDPADGGRLPANHIYSPARLPESGWAMLKGGLHRKDTKMKTDVLFSSTSKVFKTKTETAPLQKNQVGIWNNIFFCCCCC